MAKNLKYTKLLFILLVSLSVLISARSQADSIRRSESSVIKIGWDTREANKKRRNLTVEIGDSTQTEAASTFKLSLWNGECHFRVDLSSEQLPLVNASRSITSRNGQDQVVFASADVAHRLYYVEKIQVWDSTTLGVDSVVRRVMEWEVILLSRPGSNVLSYPIETENLTFYYQGFLSDAARDRGAFRADWAQDCHAVYHTHKAGSISYPDGSSEHYGTGKAFTIERLKAWDSSGDTVWCGQEIDTVAGTFSIIVPPGFLDSATYPVIIDPTFGDSDQTGGDGWDVVLSTNYAYGFRLPSMQHTAGPNETIDSLCIFGKYQPTFNLAIYTVSDSVPSAFVDTTYQLTGPIEAFGAWVKAGDLDFSLVNGSTYTICAGNASGNFRQPYDQVTDAISVDENAGGTLQDPWVDDHQFYYRFPLYAHYTVGGGAGVQPARRRRIIMGGR
ncbi:MAG: hypothetical protein JSU65_07495 [Candidatus Zixiibacteriota bacterium]|nr:MAG: hypothetical protein JSU65_07495 [candidate division Zixibacteria bacterium]